MGTCWQHWWVLCVQPRMSQSFHKGLSKSPLSFIHVWKGNYSPDTSMNLREESVREVIVLWPSVDWFFQESKRFRKILKREPQNSKKCNNKRYSLHFVLCCVHILYFNIDMRGGGIILDMGVKSSPLRLIRGLFLTWSYFFEFTSKGLKHILSVLRWQA